MGEIQKEILRKIRAKIKLGITLTKHERSYFLLYGSKEEVEEFLKNEEKRN